MKKIQVLIFAGILATILWGGLFGNTASSLNIGLRHHSRLRINSKANS